MESGGRNVRQHIADNLRALREHKGISQAEIARQMSARGWPWYTTTARRVESGEQPAQAGEAVDLAEILGVTLARLMMASEEAAEITLTDRATEILISAWKDTADAVRRLESAARAGRKRLDAAGKSRHERVRKTAGFLASQLEACTLESALAEARSPREDTGDC